MKTPSVVIEGSDLPEALRRAIDGAGKDFSVCRITHMDKQVALVSAEWIPLIMRLQEKHFTEVEFDRLFEVLTIVGNPTDTSIALADWAKSLK